MKDVIFTLTAAHILLLSKCWISWDGAEFGAPAIDPKRPYGNGDVYSDMAEILGKDYDTEAEDADKLEAEFDKLHAELEKALQIVLQCKTFEPGTFVSAPYMNEWRRV